MCGRKIIFAKNVESEVVKCLDRFRESTKSRYNISASEATKVKCLCSFSGNEMETIYENGNLNILKFLYKRWKVRSFDNFYNNNCIKKHSRRHIINILPCSGEFVFSQEKRIIGKRLFELPSANRSVDSDLHLNHVTHFSTCRLEKNIVSSFSGTTYINRQKIDSVSKSKPFVQQQMNLVRGSSHPTTPFSVKSSKAKSHLTVSGSLLSILFVLVNYWLWWCHSMANISFRRRFCTVMKQLVPLFVALLVVLPAKGETDVGVNNNVIGGVSHVGERRLFLQRNHTTMKAQTGATAALHCALVAPLADGLVSWVRRMDYHLLTVGRQVYSSDQRMGVKVSPDGSDWMLTIRWVKPQDAGEYECQVSSHPPQALIVNLSVVEAHAEILGGAELYIHSGSSLRLVCLLREATESPVYVFWYREDRMINYDTERGVTVDNSKEASVLYLDSVNSDDEGNYTCFPSNASPASVTVHVVKRENPAGLQQETSSEKDGNPSSSSSTSSSSSSTSVVSKTSSSSSSASSSSSSSSPGCRAQSNAFIISFLTSTLVWNIFNLKTIFFKKKFDFEIFFTFGLPKLNLGGFLR
ncbi:UNVERIFIED_CONTAM: hypothetical protein RMT77_002468 [Armadillidium vulgare]